MMLRQLLLDVKQQLFKGNLELAKTFSQMAKIIKEKLSLSCLAPKTNALRGNSRLSIFCVH